MITIIPKNKIPEERYLRIVDDEDIKGVLKSNSIDRSSSNLDGAGISKNRNLRSVSGIPFAMYWSKLEDEYLKRCWSEKIKPDTTTQNMYKEVDKQLWDIFHNPDSVERERRINAFLRVYNKFKTR